MGTPGGNPNTPPPPQFDVQMLFRPAAPNPNPPLTAPYPYSAPSNPNPNHPYPYSAAPPPHAAAGVAFPPFAPHAFPLYPTAPLHRPPSNPNPNPNPAGARLMALLNTPALESAASMPPQTSAPPSPADASIQASNSAPATPMRMPSSKLPRGRHLGPGELSVYDVDSRLPGELQPPQLEVTPITKYNSDPGLVLGRQIAVNRSYICYGLKMGNIRVLEINTALRELLRGHTQRVTDMAFFAEDVHLLASASVDGRVYVWKIDEGPDQENKPQISGKLVVAIQIVGDAESYHPRICWHSHKQEILLVGIGNYVLKIDTTKVGRGKEFSAEAPLICPVEKLIDGVQLIGKHDGEVTDLSISQWMTTRLVSASKDGTIKIWEDRRTMPLATLRPHDGQSVNSVEFLTSPHRPDHIVLITAGSLNKEVKIWTSTSEEGWLLPGDSESWQCTQTLELRSSAETKEEEAFFNQVVVLPRASLILLANAKKNAIYAVHVDYGSSPASTRMDYMADFTVAMPILSLTGTTDVLADCHQLVQVYCVQTQAIQQYALDLSQCLPPPNDNIALAKDSSISRGFDTPCSEGLNLPPSQRSNELPEISASPKPTLPVSSYENVPASTYPVISSSSELSSFHELLAADALTKGNALPPLSSDDVSLAASSPLLSSSDLSERITTLKISSKGLDQGHPPGDRDVDKSVIDFSANKRVDTISTSESVVSSIDGSKKVESKSVLNDISPVPSSPLMFKMGAHSPHLITPAEILSGAISSSESNLANQGEGKVHDVMISNDVKSVEAEVKPPSESISIQDEVVDLSKQQQLADDGIMVKSISLEMPLVRDEMVKECGSLTKDTNSRVESCLVEGNPIADPLEQHCSTGAKGNKQKTKQSEAPDPSSSSYSPLNSIDSSHEPGTSFSGPSTDAIFTHILSMQETLNQLASGPMELQKQISMMVAVNITKEGKRLEAALGRSMEKAVKANIDALWARVQEENAKREKERTQHITNLITTCMNKDLPSILERALKKEISAVGPNLARAMAPFTEKAISSAIAESFQRGVGDKAVNQLDKSVNSKLEATVARQIQSQFQTSGKQALQDALRSTMESSIIPAFEVSCRTMFDQVDTTVQKGLTEYTSAAQQQNESKHTPLVLTLRDAINSATSITQNVTSELTDGNRKIIALLTAGNPNSLNPLAMQQSNGSMTSRPDMVEAPLDPTKELARLISEHKYAEAFTSALQRSDVSMVSWLCSQVDLHGICSTVPLPLNQGVLLALLQQLACDINNETSRKLGWMMQVAVAINPADPMIALHVRPILEQVYNIVVHLRPSSMTSATDVRAIMHVINSVLMSCK